MAIQVVNFRDVKQHWIHDAQRWDDPRYIYIGRENGHYGLPRSIWASPYPMKNEKDRQRVIDEFKDYLMGNVDLLKQVQTLSGHILVCWCAPLPCHGHVLAELASQVNE